MHVQKRKVQRCVLCQCFWCAGVDCITVFYLCSFVRSPTCVVAVHVCQLRAFCVLCPPPCPCHASPASSPGSPRVGSVAPAVGAGTGLCSLRGFPERPVFPRAPSPQPPRPFGSRCSVHARPRGSCGLQPSPVPRYRPFKPPSPPPPRRAPAAALPPGPGRPGSAGAAAGVPSRAVPRGRQRPGPPR